jgi:hypothetical protein
MSSWFQCFSSKRRVCSSRSRRRNCKPGEIREVWREVWGEVEWTLENRGRECEGDVAVVVVAFGDLGAVGKRVVGYDGEVATVELLPSVSD